MTARPPLLEKGRAPDAMCSCANPGPGRDVGGLTLARSAVAAYCEAVRSTALFPAWGEAPGEAPGEAVISVVDDFLIGLT